MGRDSRGPYGISRMEDGGPIRVLVTEERVGPAGDPTLADLSEALIAVYGSDYGVHSPTWISRFSDMARQAAAYRKGRVLLAGDAAHVHSPAGGQGLNIGVQDAVNLGWKLAQVVNGTSPESLLETYHAERHPVAARVLRNAMAATALLRGDDHTEALRETMSELLAMDEPRKRFAAMMSGLGRPVRPRRGAPAARAPHARSRPGHRRRPAAGLQPAARCPAGAPQFGEPGSVDITPWADRVQLVDAEYAGTWELPAIGAVTAPTAVLVRPDGYVAWVGDGTEVGLDDALTTWFGPPPGGRL